MNRLLNYFRSVLFLTGLAVIINIITWLTILTQIKPNSETLPLHYNIFYGPDLVGKGFYIYIIPLVGLAVLVVNYFMYRYAIHREPFAAKTLMAIALVVQILILISVLFLKSIIV